MPRSARRIAPPRIPQPRRPKGWNISEIVTRHRRLPFLALPGQKDEPAGDPPIWWVMQHPVGTRPEWAVWWGLERNGLRANGEFFYQATVPGVGRSEFTNVDFLLPYHRLCIEVQGLYWHYGRGFTRMADDLMRREVLAARGYTLIFIDEDQALSSPIWIVKEALAFNDHSRTRKKV